MAQDDAAMLAPGEPVDLDNCAREPIHIPGSIQRWGVLLAVSEPDLVVRHTSANVEDLLGRSVDGTLGATLDDVLGKDATEQLRTHLRAWGDLRARNPLVISARTPDGLVEMDAVLHRIESGPATLLVVELEASLGPRPFSFPNTYQAVRGAVERLNHALRLEDLYDVAAQEVRSLTGFDRVMIYRFDESYNGEVVAEAKRADLNSFFGLHYPASDIPPQARALYEKNWIRLIADVTYTPAPLVPGLDEHTGLPLDLTHSVLRSVSPIHCEYLGNMGVAASMSISLLRDGRLWGLVACHHYSGPHNPPYGVRAAAEFLGSTLSLRFVARSEESALEDEISSAGVLAGLLEASRDGDHALADTLAGLGAPGAASALDLVAAQGVVVRADGRIATAGEAPDEPSALLAWVGRADGDVVVRTSLATQEPELAATLPGTAGLLALRLPDDQCIVWLRHEAVRSVDWGGDPHNKAIARREGDTVRLSPRKSFERWSEVVSGTSRSWSDLDLRNADELRARLLETLLLRNRWQLRTAQAVQRSLLPQHLPTITGWSVRARHEPAAGGEVGGDWYDALELDDGRFAVVVGDVAGHGLGAAAAMGQLRNTLRGYLLRGDDPAQALSWLDVVARRTMPMEMATAVVCLVDSASGEAHIAVAGHPRPMLLDAHGGARLIDLPVDRPIGVGSGNPPLTRVTLEPGGGLVLFSDGLVDSRQTDLRAGLARIVTLFERDDETQPVDIDDVMAACRDDASVDDLTLLVLCRDG